MKTIGIEFGSTRIKAVMVDQNGKVIASGGYEWENKFENGYWTYSLDEVKKGLQGSYADLNKCYKEKYGEDITEVDSIGISGMMHGYLAFDENDKLLVPFRTWRNTTTEKAADELSELFDFNIPQRWSIAHLYQAILNKEPHVTDISYITTLAVYIHYLLTGKKEVGIGEASGMFPISGNDYDSEMLKKFDKRISDKGFKWSIYDVLPKVKLAGENDTKLSAEGAALIDPSGKLTAGITVCPPEGDAGTGMVATNAVLPRTGNVSAGTSVFAMLVLENQLNNIYKEIDMVTTPDGSPVAMVHCNNCCAELDAWIKIFGEFASLFGIDADKSTLYEKLYKNALTGAEDCGGVMAYNYLSGEHVTGVEKGRPMYFRFPDAEMNLANFMRAQLYSSIASIKYGMDILFNKEKAQADKFLAHGGLFKVEGVAQQILANATNAAVSVMETAGEGGAWGMALLALYAVSGEGKLGEWLEEKIFSDMKSSVLNPQKKGVEGFTEYMIKYQQGLAAEKKLGEVD